MYKKMEIPSIQLSLEHIEELDFTCPAAKKSINIGKEIIPVKFVVNIYPDVKRDYFKLITGVRYIRRRNFIGQELLFYRIAVVYKIEKLSFGFRACLSRTRYSAPSIRRCVSEGKHSSCIRSAESPAQLMTALQRSSLRSVSTR